MNRPLFDLDLSGENDVALTEFRSIESIKGRLQARHRLRVTSRNEPIGVLLDIPTAQAMEAEYQRLASDLETLREVLRRETDRADDESLARLCRERLADDEPIVSGAEGVATLARLYEESVEQEARARPR
ncbi:MAG: hypothetical protein ACYDGM_08690 [Vulcanimicrobiaceae bacterium]